MNRRTALFLNDLNARFYRAQALSFSATRRSPWPGWRRLLPFLEAAFRDRDPATLLDVGCGNLRFEAFLAQGFPKRALSVCAVDACEPLVACASELPENVRVESVQLDVVAVLAAEKADDADGTDALGGTSLVRAVGREGLDAAVAFGVLHHVPGERLRRAALAGLFSCVRHGGVVAVSLWRFLDNEKMAANSDAAHAQACAELAADPVAAAFDLAQLEPGDRLLGWQGRPGAYRFCHSFSDADVDGLVATAEACGANLVARFKSDGRTAKLNEYLVFRVEGC